ncbi:EAL domain-containing protein [Ruminococcus gauvreauii]|uniref:EAL domain-containing protein n=1 Tax=Ruminococcus gauvreauii TaxID=438033 RepID=A0ABY5VDW9_9FIRM|nr:EAL domain-containing protein [Ruminococcus gauvreauii]UWP58178.1 EAL domain-containing protein [Ruminococcus gauvreauii]
MERLRRILNNNIFIFSVRQGLLLTIPFLMIGSFSLVIMNFPVNAWQEYLSSVAGGTIHMFLMGVYQATFGSLSFIFALMISYAYGEEQRVYENTRVFFPAVTLCSFIAFCYPSGGLSIWGPEWSFTAICITIFSCWLLTAFYRLVSLHQRLYTVGVAYNFNASMQSLVPAVLTVAACGICGIILFLVFDDTNIMNFGSYLFMRLFGSMGNGLASMLLYIVISHVLWFFGIHGTNTLEAVSRKLFESEILINQDLLAQGLLPTHIFSKTFLDTFVFIGGCGSALCMVLALFLVARKKNNRRLAKLSLPAVVFNINELVLFGFPIIFSADMILPFILTPVVLTGISSLAMYLNLVPVASQSVEWTVPVLFSGYMATGSFRGSLLQLVNLAAGTLIYIPFIKKSEDIQEKEFMCKIRKLETAMDEEQHSVWVQNFHWKTYENRQTAKLLTADLQYALTKGELQLHYQPQMYRDGRLYGCEALLRWNYMGHTYIYPPLIIALAVQSGFIDSLGLAIIRMACADMKQAERECGFPITFSVNILPLQLENRGFALSVGEIIKETGVNSKNMTIELTEQVALNPGPVLEKELGELKDAGIRISMDDFGMGHGSLNYLNSTHFDEVKIDGALIRRLPGHAQTCELVGNIMNMSQILRVDTVAECVETEEQVSMLDQLGCGIYQGYYYSRPLPLYDFIRYLKGTEHL